jgi:tape measure domain-containing protein
MTDIVTLGFAVSTRGLIAGERGLDKFARKGEQTERRINKNTKKINSDFMSLNKTIGLVAVSIAAIGSLSIARDLIAYSDAWKGINSQIRQVTESEEELLITRQKLLNLSKETRSELEGTVFLFAEMKRGTSELNISSDRLLGVTRTLNNLFTAGGKPISEVTGAIRQLNQGFASGVLRGDEFNSVAEGAPKVLDALTAHLKITRGELREFAATGGITAEIMILALEKYSETAQKLADQTEKTFAQNLANAKTNMTAFVGESKVLNDTFNTLGSSIEDFSENLDAAADAGLAFAAVYGVAVVSAISKSIAANIGKIASDIAAERAAFAVSVAEQKRALSIAVSEVATTKANAAAIFGETARTRSVMVALEAEAALEAVRLKAQISDTGRMMTATRMAEIQIARLAITKQLAAAEVQQAVASGLATEAQLAQMAATSGLAKVQVVATGTTRALGVATRFLLGPWGLLLTAIGAAAAIYLTTKDAANELKDQQDLHAKSVNKLSAEFENFSNKRIGDLYVSTMRKAIKVDAEKIRINEELATAEKQKNKILSELGTGGGVEAFSQSLIVVEKLKSELENLNIVGAKNEQILTAITEVFNNGLPKIGEYSDKLTDVSDVLAKAQEAFEQTIATLSMQTAELTMSADAFELYGARMNAIATGATPEMIASIEAIIIVNQKLRKDLEDKEGLNLDDLISSVDDFGGAWSKSGSIIVDTFGDISDALGDYSKQMIEIGKLEQEIAERRKLDGVDNAELIRLQESLNISRTQAELGGMKAVSSATASLFDEKTGAARALFALNKIITVAEIALTFQKMAAGTAAAGVHIANEGAKTGANALTAITGAFAAPFPINFIAGAAMIGIMASLLGGSSGGGGAGTGDIEEAATSESISNSQKMMDIQLDQLKELRGIRDDLNQVTNETNLLAKQVAGGASIGGSFAATLPTKTPSVAGLDIGNISLRDLGIDISLGDLSGFGNVDGFDPGGTGVNRVMKSIVATIVTAMESLDIGTKSAIDGFVFSLKQFDTEGMTLSEITEELTGQFSAQSDMLIAVAIPEIIKFQKNSEELFETLIRVTKEQVVFTDSMDQIGKSISDLSTILEIEMAQNIIALTGGIERFSDLTSEFFSEFFTEAEQFEHLSTTLTETVNDLGLTMFDSRDQFRATIEGIDLTTEAGQRLFAGLLELTPAMDELFDTMEQNAKDAIKLQENSIKSSFVMLQKSVDLERQRAAAILDVAKIAHDAEITRLDDLRAFLNKEQSIRQQAFNNAERALNASFANEISSIQAASNLRLQTLSDERSALDNMAQPIRSLVSSISSAIGLDGSTDLIGALASARAGDFERAQALDLASLTNINEDQFESAEEMAIQQAVNANRLAAISELATDRLSGIDGIIEIIDFQIDATETHANELIAALNEQLLTLTDIDNNILGLDESISNFNQAKFTLDSLNYTQELARLDLLVVSANDVFDLHEQAYSDELARLDTIIEDNERLLNAALGIDDSIMSVSDSIDLLSNAINDLDMGSTAIPPPPTHLQQSFAATQQAPSQDVSTELKNQAKTSNNLSKEIVKNTATTARLLQRIELNGLDTRIIT